MAGCPAVYSFHPTHILLFKINSSYMCWFFFPTVRWIQMTPSTVCFGARDDSYGFFRTSKAGNIITFKLTYRSGYVTCDAQKSSFHSKWGYLWNRLIPNQMATLITDKNRNLLLPKSDFLSDYGDCKFYRLPWTTTESPQLLFDNLSTPPDGGDEPRIPNLVQRGLVQMGLWR